MPELEKPSCQVKTVSWSAEGGREMTEPEAQPTSSSVLPSTAGQSSLAGTTVHVAAAPPPTLVTAAGSAGAVELTPLRTAAPLIGTGEPASTLASAQAMCAAVAPAHSAPAGGGAPGPGAKSAVTHTTASSLEMVAWLKQTVERQALCIDAPLSRFVAAAADPQFGPSILASAKQMAARIPFAGGVATGGDGSAAEANGMGASDPRCETVVRLYLKALGDILCAEEARLQQVRAGWVLSLETPSSTRAVQGFVIRFFDGF